jgi:hypothetical protein
VLKILENYITELHDRPNRPVTLEVEPEEEVDADEKGLYILRSEVEKAIKEMRKKNATGDDDVPGDVFKLLGEGGLKIITKLINTIYESGEWPKDLTEVTMIVLKKKPQAFSNSFIVQRLFTLVQMQGFQNCSRNQFG